MGFADWRAVAWKVNRVGINAYTVKAVIRNYMELAASELKKKGSFKIGGYMELKLMICVLCGRAQLPVLRDFKASLKCLLRRQFEPD